MSYSTKKSKKKYRTQKDDKAKNIFQGDLRGYYACDATMIKKERKKEKKSVRQKVRRGVKLLKNKTQDCFVYNIYICIREREDGKLL